MIRKKFFMFLFVAFFVIFCSGIPFLDISGFSFALSEKNGFDGTYVLDDLIFSTVNGEPFDLSDYPYDSDGSEHKLSVLSFVEYCYSYYANAQINYCLYLYIYNPQGFSFNKTSMTDRIEIATSYDGNGIPDSYEKFQLKFCSVSSGDYAGLFYKYRVIDHAAVNGKTILKRVTESVRDQNLSGVVLDNCERRYDISGIEFRYDNAAANGVNKNKSVDHAVGGSYIFKGFASGYGADGYADSTLISSVTDMETVSLEVKDTYWRTDNPERGDYAEDQLTSVYFSVPDYYINTYGDLYGIRAEWYEYKTKPIVVSSSGALNNYIPGRLGLSTAEDLSDDARSLYYNYLFDGTNIPTWWWAWNPYIIGIPGVNGGPYLDKLYWYFYSSDLVVKPSDIKNFLETDFARTEEYNTYLKDRFGNDLAFSDGGQFIRSVYWDSAVDTGRTRGYNLYDFTVDDAYLSVGGTVNIKNIWNIIFGQDGKNYGTTFTNVKMIEDVTNFIPNNDHYWDNLFISEDDYSVIQNQAYTAGQHTYLFRFAQTSYDGFPLDIYKHEFYRPLDSHWSGQAYTVQTTDFFNFDIISLTFARDGVYRVIPAVSDPIDVLPGLTPPTGIFDVGDWWQELLEILKWVLGIILLILILYAVATLVPSVLSVLFGGLGLLKPSGRRKNKIVNKIYLDGIKGKYKKRK